MALYRGESVASGLENEARGLEYTGKIQELEGEEKMEASELAAAGTLAGSIGQAAKGYGSYAYPQYRWGS